MDVTAVQLLEGGAFVSVREVVLDEPGAVRVVTGVSVASRPVVAVSGNQRFPLVSSVATSTLGASVTVKDWLRVGVAAPLQAWDGADGAGSGVGDVAAFVGVPVARGFAAHVESSFGGAGAGRWLGAPSTAFAVVSSGHAGVWTLGADAGVRFQDRVELPGLAWGTRLELGAGATRPVVDLGRQWHLAVGAEGRGSAPIGEPFTAPQLPAEVAAVVSAADPRLRISSSVAGGLTRGLGSPGLRVGVTLDWRVGRPADQDADRVWDLTDRCDHDPEDRDHFDDRDGCPDPDDDLDGIFDVVDTCPRAPETANGWRDHDGCPDERAVVAVRLEGVDEALVRLGQDVLALTERGPVAWVTDPGRWPVSGAVEDSVLVPEGPSEVVLHVVPAPPPPVAPTSDADPVPFALDDDHLPPGADAGLDAITRWLREHPEVWVLRIEGHADGSGSSAWNLDLSRRRAAAVREGLIARGIAPERLDVVGSGEVVAAARSVTFTVLAWDDRGGSHDVDVLACEPCR